MTASRVWKNVPFINRLEKQVSGSFFCQYVGVNVLVCPTFLSIYSFMQATGMLTSSCLLSHFQCPSELWSCIDSCSACCYDGSVYIVERQVSGQYFDGVVPLWGSVVIRISQFKHFPVIIFIMAWDKISPSAVAADYCNNSAFVPISQFGEAKVDWCVYYTFCCATGLLHKTGWVWLMLTYLMQQKCIIPSTTN